MGVDVGLFTALGIVAGVCVFGLLYLSLRHCHALPSWCCGRCRASLPVSELGMCKVTQPIARNVSVRVDAVVPLPATAEAGVNTQSVSRDGVVSEGAVIIKELGDLNELGLSVARSEAVAKPDQKQPINPPLAPGTPLPDSPKPATRPPMHFTPLSPAASASASASALPEGKINGQRALRSTPLPLSPLLSLRE
jgi:hypothetical protein